MRIANVRAFLLSYPLPEPLVLSYYGGERTIIKRDAMFVRAETDAGVVGYGPGVGTPAVQKATKDVIAPFLAGRALADPDALRVHFLEGPGRDPFLAKTYCAIEIALYD